ncbi:MAG: hypothetical protein R3224_10830 [Balneolaceae bacterium]|nr:hypothetical protein [Balneolaceae bacterium]
MTELLETAGEWLMGLGEQYGVNPVVFATLYVLSIPPYLFSIGWIVRNYRRDRPLLMPILSTGLFFIAPAIYLVAAGRNVPWYFYAAVAAMVVYGIYGTWRKVNRRVNKQMRQNEYEV